MGKLALADIKAVVTGVAVADIPVPALPRGVAARRLRIPSDQGPGQGRRHRGDHPVFRAVLGFRDASRAGSHGHRDLGPDYGFLKEASFKHHVRASGYMVLTDVHARLSENNEAQADAYFAAIGAEAAKRGFAVTRLSTIWSSHGIDLEHLFEQGRRLSWDEAWNGCAEVGPETRERFVHATTKPVDGAEPDLAAKVYLLACRREREKVAATFPDAIFVTYHQPDHDFCLPPLPRVYMLSGEASRPADEPIPGRLSVRSHFLEFP